jgi:S1-C subfamily serine protease
VEEAVRGIVRLDARLRFRVTIYAQADSAAAARQRLRSAPHRGKQFRPNGEVVWPVALDTAQVRATCRNPVASHSPGLFDICQTWDATSCKGYPCSMTTNRLAGGSTGFVIGRRSEGQAPTRLLVGTAYHVAREAIERLDRTGGQHAPEPEPTDYLTIRLPTDGPAGTSDRAIDDVHLVAHASEAEWKAGKDWALLSIPARSAPPSVRVLPVADTRPEPGDTLWAIGYPFRTVRDLQPSDGYANASGDLRISVGRVADPDTVSADMVEPTDIVTTLDGVSGNSGSPVLNREGEVVGLFRTTTWKRGDVDRRVAQYGGLTLVAPIQPLRTMLQQMP